MYFLKIHIKINCFFDYNGKINYSRQINYIIKLVNLSINYIYVCNINYGILYVDNDNRNDRKIIRKKIKTRKFYVKNLSRKNHGQRKKKFINIEKQ